MEKFFAFTLDREIISPLDQFEIRDLLSLDAPTFLSGKQNTTWVKLPNSGDLLKLLVLSYSWKAICGWSNNSGIVTSQKMIERKMEYRGSKSVVNKNTTVKEQRVDGNYTSNLVLRYTLMGFERNYQVKVPSHLIFKKQYSTNNITRIESSDSIVNHFTTNNQVKYSINHSTNGKLNSIHPFFITGFTDAEGSFMISVKKSSAYRRGWKVQASYVITLHKKDLELLQNIQASLGGSIDPKGEDILQLRIFSTEQITKKIIPHFEKYPLLTQKKADFELFKIAVEIINRKGHLTNQGLQEIVNIKASMNKDLSNNLREAFPSTVDYPRPLVGEAAETLKIQDPNWLAGFTSGEGCFYIKQRESNNNKKIVEVIFSISQHSRDKFLMRSLVDYLECGRISESKNAIYYTCSRFSDVWDKILPFFNEFKILGVKSQDFKKWSEICEMVKSKHHLTKEGSNIIREIKTSMNQISLARTNKGCARRPQRDR